MIKKIRNLEYKPLIFLLIVLTVFSIGGTIAYFSKVVTLPNKFITMTYDVGIIEEFYDDWGTKKVTFVNNEETSTPVVLRINYNELWSKEISDYIFTLNNTVNGTNVVDKDWTDEFISDFILGDDGWYYYKKVLNKKESVQVLNSISLNESLISTSPYYDDYKSYNYNLSFNYEAIQADKKAVKEIWNKDITISGGNVTWE